VKKFRVKILNGSKVTAVQVFWGGRQIAPLAVAGVSRPNSVAGLSVKWYLGFCAKAGIFICDQQHEYVGRRMFRHDGPRTVTTQTLTQALPHRFT